MRTQRISGLIALSSGLVLVVALVASALLGSAFFANMGSSGNASMGPGMMAASHMGGGMMMGMGPGMMGFGSSSPAAPAIPSAPEVRVQAANFSFTPSEIRLPKGTGVNLTFTNPGNTGVVHDLTVPALDIHIAANSGETQTVGLRGLAAGRYDAYCSVPGHADLGMRAVVVVE